jgi:hypothetical protein
MLFKQFKQLIRSSERYLLGYSQIPYISWLSGTGFGQTSIAQNTEICTEITLQVE